MEERIRTERDKVIKIEEIYLTKAELIEMLSYTAQAISRIAKAFDQELGFIPYEFDQKRSRYKSLLGQMTTGKEDSCDESVSRNV